MASTALLFSSMTLVLLLAVAVLVLVVVVAAFAQFLLRGEQAP